MHQLLGLAVAFRLGVIDDRPTAEACSAQMLRAVLGIVLLASNVTNALPLLRAAIVVVGNVPRGFLRLSEDTLVLQVLADLQAARDLVSANPEEAASRLVSVQRNVAVLVRVLDPPPRP